MLLSQFPTLGSHLQNTIIPLSDCDDSQVLSFTESGTLSFKEAYLFLKPKNPIIKSCKIIWQNFTSPSKSLVFWRGVQNKLPTDEFFRKEDAFVCLCAAYVPMMKKLFNIFSVNVSLLLKSGIGPMESLITK